MKNSWILISVSSGFLTGLLTYIFTQNWKISIAAVVIATAVVFLRNPKTRFMRAFYVILFTLIAKLWFLLDITTETLDLKVGLNKINNTSVIVLSFLAFFCLLFDFIERNDHISFSFNSKKNSTGNITGDDNQIDQKNG